MLPTELPKLPAWASYATDEDGNAIAKAGRVLVVVDGDAAYPSVLDEYARLYERVEDRPDFVKAADWPEVWDELTPEDPEVLSAYWLEVAYQSIKMDVQRVTGFALNLTISHPTVAGKERYRQSDAPAGKLGARGAAGGAAGGRDARHHYKKLRGFLVA